MKPFAVVLTYADQPTRAFAEEVDAQRELERLNAAYKADRARRKLMPVYTWEQVQQILRGSVQDIAGG